MKNFNMLGKPVDKNEIVGELRTKILEKVAELILHNGKANVTNKHSNIYWITLEDDETEYQVDWSYWNEPLNLAYVHTDCYIISL